MNDFTKEELEYLYHTIDNIVECYSEPDIGYLVRDKIQRMIDNYCDHHFEAIKDCFDQYIPVCMKCGVN